MADEKKMTAEERFMLELEARQAAPVEAAPAPPPQMAPAAADATGVQAPAANNPRAPRLSLGLNPAVTPAMANVPGYWASRFAEMAARQITGNNVSVYDVQSADEIPGLSGPERLALKSYDAAGSVAGIVPFLTATAGAGAPLTRGLAQLGFRAPQAAAGTLAFMGHEAIAPGTDAGSIADAGWTGIGLSGAHAVPGIKQLTQTPLGSALWNAIAMGGLTKLQGGKWDDVTAAALTGPLLTATGATDPRRYPGRNPAEVRSSNKAATEARQKAESMLAEDAAQVEYRKGEAARAEAEAAAAKAEAKDVKRAAAGIEKFVAKGERNIAPVEPEPTEVKPLAKGDNLGAELDKITSERKWQAAVEEDAAYAAEAKARADDAARATAGFEAARGPAPKFGTRAPVMSADAALPPERPDVKRDVRRLRPGTSPAAPESVPGSEQRLSSPDPIKVGGEAPADFPADRAARNSSESPVSPSSDLYLGSGLGGAQEILSVAGRRLAGRVTDGMKRAGWDAEQVRNAPVSKMYESEVFSAYLNGEVTLRGAHDLLLQGRAKLAGVLTPEGLSRAAQELRNEGVKNPSQKDIESRARVNTLDPEVTAEIAARETGKLNQHAAQFMEPITAVQTVAGGKLNSPIVKATQGIGGQGELVAEKAHAEMAERAKSLIAESGIKSGTEDASAVGRVLDGRPNPLEGAKDPVAVVELSRKLRPLFQEWWDMRQIINELYRSEGLGKIDENYLPHYERRAKLLKEPGYWTKQMFSAREGRSTVGRGSPETLSTREMARSGELTPNEIDYDIHRVLDKYINDQANRLPRQVTIASSEAVVSGMREEAARMKTEAEAEMKMAADNPAAMKAARQKLKDAKWQERSADALSKVQQSAYNDRPYSLRQIEQEIFGAAIPGTDIGLLSPVAKTLRNVVKPLFNAAHYPLNFAFIMLRMPTSAGLLGSYPGVWQNWPKWVGTSLQEMPTPYAQQLVDSTVNGWRKQTTAGSIVSEGGQAMAGEGSGIAPSSMYRKALNKASIPANRMENNTSKFAALMAEKIAEHIGIPEADRSAFRGRLIAKTQSLYHPEGMSDSRKSPVFNALWPAQSFSQTAAGNALEAAFEKYGMDFEGMKNVTPGQKARIGRALGAVFGMYVTNMIHNYVNTKEDLTDPEGVARFAGEGAVSTLEAFAPYSDIITGRGPSQGRSYAADIIGDTFGTDRTKGVRQYVSGGIEAARAGDQEKAALEFEKAAQMYAKHYLPAGSQASKVLSADILIKRGVLDESDRALASVAGWWTTTRGKEHMRKMSGLDYSEDEPVTGGDPSGNPAVRGGGLGSPRGRGNPRPGTTGNPARRRPR